MPPDNDFKSSVDKDKDNSNLEPFQSTMKNAQKGPAETQPNLEAPEKLRVIKRNGTIVQYNGQKIQIAITKAFLAVEGGMAAASSRVREIVDEITDQVTSYFQRRMPSGGTIHIDDIQDQVEIVLMLSGEHKVAREYILRRENDKSQSKKTGQEKNTQSMLSETLKAQQEYLIAQSIGLDTNLLPLPRFIPIRIYLADGFNSKGIVESVENLATAMEIDINDRYDPIIGSFFRKLLGKTQEAMTHPELMERLEKAERHLELSKINLVQSEIDKNLANAFAAVKASLEGEEQAVIQLSSLFIVKTINSDGKPVVLSRVLTQKQLKYLEQNPSITQCPANVFELLDSVKDIDQIRPERKAGTNRRPPYSEENG